MLELTEKTLDILHPQCANILDEMAKTYKKQANFQAAIMVYQRILVVRDFNNPTNDAAMNKESYRNMGQLAETYMFDGQFKIAADLLTKGAEVSIYNKYSMRYMRCIYTYIIYDSLGVWSTSD